MYCINCGDKLTKGEKFCTNCGERNPAYGKTTNETKKNKKPLKSIIITFLIASAIWFFYYFGFVDKTDQSINIISHLLETVGRQKQAWIKSEEITGLISAAITDECIYTEGCVDQAIDRITTLRAEIDKESSEIDVLWSENVIGLDFEEYYSSLDGKDQIKLMDLMDTYFPEESEELEAATTLL